jgi:S-formylglutathione hydrolase FrmB
MRAPLSLIAICAVLATTDCARVTGEFEAFNTKWNNASRFVAKNSVSHHALKSRILGQTVGYSIYLPEDYQTSHKRYPVVYFLHGAGQDETTAVVLTQKRSLPYIMVFPNGGKDTMYANHRGGRLQVHDYLVEELIPHVDATYRTLANRESRLVSGFSMGGWGAHMLAYKHPQLFGAAQSIGAPFFDAEQFSSKLGATYQGMFGANRRFFEAFSPRDLLAKNQHSIRNRTRIQIWIGSRDYLYPTNPEMHRLLGKLGIAHQYYDEKKVPALAMVDHELERYIEAAGDQVLAFHRDFFFKKEIAAIAQSR